MATIDEQDKPLGRFTLTKIVATVGPATLKGDTLQRLIEEGARVFRLNFSHGTFDEFQRSLEAVRKAAELSGRPIAVFGDLCGPKIRVGKVVDGGVELTAGDTVVFQRPAIVAGNVGGEVRFSLTQSEVLDDIEPGDRVLIDDGNVRMLATGVEGTGDDRLLTCSVTVGGKVSSAKGVNLPDSALSVPSITEYDWQCVDWAIKHGLDYLALSFVRQAADVTELRKALKKKAGPHGPIPVIAKIEKPQAIEDLANIVEQSQAVMVARGDLGVEMDAAEVPALQKRIIAACRAAGKPVIVATQMLQSMIDSPIPTRAEASDVANAIYEGADAVMLSGETAVGKFPIPTVHIMARIARLTQQDMTDHATSAIGRIDFRTDNRYRTAALAHGVATVVRDLNARMVVTWSEQGGGAGYLSQHRLGIPILAASTRPHVLRHMALLHGVIPVELGRPASSEAFVHDIDQLIQKRGWAMQGDAVVIVKGDPIGTPGVTNELRIHYVGDVCKLA